MTCRRLPLPHTSHGFDRLANRGSIDREIDFPFISSSYRRFPAMTCRRLLVHVASHCNPWYTRQVSMSISLLSLSPATDDPLSYPLPRPATVPLNDKLRFAQQVLSNSFFSRRVSQR